MALPWKDKTFRLSNDVLMPCIGLGTYKIKSTVQIEESVMTAMENGYRHIDTAQVYRNEALIGRFLTAHSRRSEWFLTSKLAPNSHGFDESKAAFFNTLKDLGTSYLDLYLIHWPGAQGKPVDDEGNRAKRLESWRGLEDLYSLGHAKAIGVSNFSIDHLKDILDNCVTRPHVNQIEVHPHFQQRELVDFCQSNNIHVTAYSSLGTTVAGGEVNNPLLNDPVVRKVSVEVGKKPAQVLLVWALQKGLSVIPKSTNPGHIRSNIGLDFELASDHMVNLDNIAVDKKYAWDPSSVD